MVSDSIVVNEEYSEISVTTIASEVYWVRDEESGLDKDVSESNDSGDWLYNVDKYNWRVSVGSRVDVNIGMVWDQCVTAEWVSGAD